MKKTIALFCTVACLLTTAWSQNLDVTHFMRLSPFQNMDNPSCESIYNGYVSLPGGMVHVGGNLGSIRYKKLFETDEEGYPVTLTPTKFVNSLAKNNYLGINSAVELWGFGFRTGKVFVTVDHRLRVNTDVRYSKALFGLPVYGNMAYTEKPADMNITANVNAYQELGISLRHEINDKMAWGIRPKVLFGIANLRANKVNAVLTTDPVTYDLAMTYNADVRAAAIMPYNLTFDKENGFNLEYSTNVSDITGNMFKNWGVGLDLGFTFKPLPQVSVSLSVLDLGYIGWRTSTTKMTSVLHDAGRFYEDGSMVFAGLTRSDIETLIDGGNLNELLDTLAYYFPLDVTPTGAYYTATPMRVVMQGDWEFAKHHRLSAAAQFRFASNYVQPSLTVAYDGCFFNMIDVCVAYTMQRMSFDNLGFGLGLNLGYLNLYAGTQNLVAAMAYQDASQLTATVGLVFNWGHFKNWRTKNPKTKKEAPKKK